MHVILIAIGMHKNPCVIGSLAFTAVNWESRCNTDLILLQKKVFSAQKHDGAIKYKCAIMSDRFLQIGSKFLLHKRLIKDQDTLIEQSFKQIMEH